MSPNLRSDHHILFTIPDKWIVKAKEIKELEDKKSGSSGIFHSKNRWVGKIGEWAVYTTYPGLKPVTQHFNPTKYDFKSKETDLIYEVKTNVSNYPFEDHFEFNINDRQYQENNNDIYIACHYMLESPYIRICGWLYKSMVKTRGVMLKKGEKYKNKFEVRADQWSIPYKELNSMHLLPG